jgi:hypothetical protein
MTSTETRSASLIGAPSYRASSDSPRRASATVSAWKASLSGVSWRSSAAWVSPSK